MLKTPFYLCTFQLVTIRKQIQLDCNHGLNKQFKINDMVYHFDTVFVCDECPGITIIMSTQINLEQDWVS